MMNQKKYDIKNRTCYYINDTNFDFDNILIAEKPLENILVNKISYKALIGEKTIAY